MMIMMKRMILQASWGIKFWVIYSMLISHQKVHAHSQGEDAISSPLPPPQEEDNQSVAINDVHYDDVGCMPDFDQKQHNCHCWLPGHCTVRCLKC